MKSLNAIVGKLPKELFERAVFVTGDVGVTQLQKYLGREVRHGVFFRFLLDKETCSGVVETADEGTTRGALLEIPPVLQQENAKLLNAFRLPLKRLSLFPFFTIIDDIPKRTKEKIRNDYWGKFHDNLVALREWYLGYLRYKREIVFSEIPEFELDVPDWIQFLRVFVLYNEEDNTIATKYYRSDEDSVIVKMISEGITVNNWEELSSKLFDLPPKENYVHGSIYFSGVNKPAFHQWSHPYFAAAEDLKERVKRFNSAQPSLLISAHEISNAMLRNWTLKGIKQIRELAARFTEVKEEFQSWLKGVQVLVVYFIDEPRRGWVTDGTLTSYYVNGPEDKIVVRRVWEKEKIRYDEALIKQYLPESNGKPFYGVESLILRYLEDKLGF